MLYIIDVIYCSSLYGNVSLMWYVLFHHVVYYCMHCKLKCCVYTVLVFNAKQHHYNQVHFRGAPPTFPTPQSCNVDSTIKLFDSYVCVTEMVRVMSVIVFSL